MFDIRILVLSTMLVSFILLIEMIVLARIFPRQNYLKFLIASYLLLTLAMLGWVLRGVLPDFISIVVAGFLIAAKYYIDICAAETLFGRNKYRINIYGPALILFAGAFYYYSAIEPNFSYRLILSAIFFGGLSFIFGWTLLKGSPQSYSAIKCLGGLAIVNALAIFARVVPGFFNLDQDSLMSFSGDKQIIFIIAILLTILYGFFIVMLALQIDAAEVKAQMTVDK